ncbi:MAG TPA: serine hydrolase [Gemmatimonadales bacterium]|nr:serine hydrolase [Gemmatimonadales bacterium]
MPSSARLSIVLATAVLATPLRAQDSIAAADRYAPVAALLGRLVQHEMADKDLPALSLVLVDGSNIVWAKGFGWARPDDSVRASAATVYRVGSVSKLFTDLAVMRLVEQGRLDLDAPITRYLPEFRPRNRFGGDVTLRTLMSHHSGLVREPPVGAYVDSTAPPLSAMVASLSSTSLVYRPGMQYKYSNAALHTVGLALERAAGLPFQQYLRDSVLDPLGMKQSAFFEPRPDQKANVAMAFMWATDGRRFPAPTFRRNAPAGALYSSVLDLGRFLVALFADSNPVIGRSTLERMWVPQFTDTGATAGNGLGFFVSRFDGHRRLGHEGAIFGFSTTFAALPDDRLGVVVVTTLGGANVVSHRIADAALRAMLAVRAGISIPEPAVTDSLPTGMARRAEGHYQHGARSVDLLERGGELFLSRDGGSVPSRLRAAGDTLTIDDAISFGGGVRLMNDGVVVDGDTFARAPWPAPPDAPTGWKRFLGEYGWGHETLFIFERGGRLHALTAWLDDEVLAQVSDSVFALPATGLYVNERVTFRGVKRGRATAAVVGTVMFPRREIGPAGGGQLRVTPLKPVAELLAAAQNATPPAESGAFRAPDLVELVRLDATIRLDIRYAGTNNFLGSVFYASARAFLQRPAAQALVRAHHRLRALGYGLLIHDGYRPWYVTKTFWDATPPAQRWMVANPARGSRHNRGCAVDLTIFDLRTGQPLDMGGTYDEATERSFPDYPVATSLERWRRELLRQVMEDEGFTRNVDEWWHFDYRDWREYPILNQPFAALGSP